MINLSIPKDEQELKPRITVIGVGGAGGNAVNNMIRANLIGCEFIACNTDAQSLQLSAAPRKIQLGIGVTRGLGAGSRPDVGRAAAEEAIDDILESLQGSNMVFITAGMGGGTGSGAAPVIARIARESGILTVGVVTKPFHFEGVHRMRTAEGAIEELQKFVDTLIIIPNQNLFRVANERTTFADAFKMADDVLHAGVRGVTDLMVMPGLINLDFADIRTVMSEMGKAMMGTGEASGEKRALTAAEAAIANPLIDDASMKGARGLLISITGGKDLTLYEVDEAATRIREEVDQDANIIVGATFDESLEGIIRVSVVATGIDHTGVIQQTPAAPAENALKELASKMRNDSRRIADRVERANPAKPLAAPAVASAAMQHAAHAAVAAAILPGHAIEEVSLRPMPAKPSLFDPMPAEALQFEAPMPATFIPPMPEPAIRQQRMPRIDELPVPAQNEIRAQRGEVADNHPEKQRLSLMQRLASVGLGRREEAEAPPPPRAARPMPPVDRPAQRPTARNPEGRYPEPWPAESRPADPVSEYARRPAPQGLDPHGRTAPVHNSTEEDQLDIPAFLRRQAN